MQLQYDMMNYRWYIDHIDSLHSDKPQLQEGYVFLDNMYILGIFYFTNFLFFCVHFGDFRRDIRILIFSQCLNPQNCKRIPGPFWLETLSEYRFGVVGPKYFKVVFSGKLRKYYQHTTVASFYWSKLPPALKSLSDTRFGVVYEAQYMVTICQSLFNFMVLDSS